MVDASSARDIKEASALESYTLPKLYLKRAYCISCAIHARLRRVRDKVTRRKRQVLTRTVDNHAPQRGFGGFGR